MGRLASRTLTSASPSQFRRNPSTRRRENPAHDALPAAFDRENRQATVQELPDHGDALDQLFEAEARLRDHPQPEIVLVTAADQDDLRRTHARYFESIDELLEFV